MAPSSIPRSPIISVVPLDLVTDGAEAFECFRALERLLLPRLPGFLVGVATPLGVIPATSPEAFTALLFAANGALSYDDIPAFAEDRASRVVAQISDPNVAAMWMYNGGRLKESRKTRACIVAILKALQRKLLEEAATSVRLLARGLQGKMSGHGFGFGAFGQKPVLGYCYGTAIMSVLALAGIGRPVHCPLVRDAALYLEYEPARLETQLQDLAGAIAGDLQAVTLPSLEPRNLRAHLATADGAVFEGLVLCGLLQIIHGTVLQYVAKKHPSIPLILLVEYLEFGDEAALLMELAAAHRAGRIRIVCLCNGYAVGKGKTGEPAHAGVLAELAAAASDVPVFAGLPIGHARPNHVVPMGWATFRCPGYAPAQGFRLEYSRLPAGHFEMVPRGHPAPEPRRRALGTGYNDDRSAYGGSVGPSGWRGLRERAVGAAQRTRGSHGSPRGIPPAMSLPYGDPYGFSGATYSAYPAYPAYPMAALPPAVSWDQAGYIALHTAR